VKRAERKPDPNRPRFELDRRWIMRGLVAIVIVGALLLIAKVSIMAFGGAGRRLERVDAEQAVPAVAPGVVARRG
jgi:hypothetical protein